MSEAAAAQAGGDGGDKEIFRHPETGEIISKNAWKKLQKGEPLKKEKKEKPLLVAKASTTEKKEAKKKEKEPEEELCDFELERSDSQQLAARTEVVLSPVVSASSAV